MKMENKQVIKLNIPDMTCSHCASVVTKAIKSVDGDARIGIDYATRSVTVESSAEAESLSRAVDEAGYPNSAN